MRVKLHRPRYQRNARILLAAALLIPAAGFLQAAAARLASASRPDIGASVGLVAAAVLAALAVLAVYDALRPVAIVTRHGIGIAGTLGSQPTWIAWSEIVRVEDDGGVVSIETRGRQLYQLGLSARAARFIAARVERQIIRRRPWPAC